MDGNILNIDQAVEFLGVSEKTLIKLLREEHIPARKIGREWRFNKQALLDWLAGGDSCNYINRNEIYEISEDKVGNAEFLLHDITEKISALKEINNIREVLKLDMDIDIPEEANLRISYKQKRDIEKFEFKIYWPLRDKYKINSEQNKNSL